VTITGTDTTGAPSHTTAVTLVVVAPDFSLSATPPSQTVTQGQVTSYNVNVTPTNGYTGSVNLSASGLPAGANATFSPNPTPSGSTMTVTTSTNTPAGSYAVTITGTDTSGAPSHTTSVTLVVKADFSLSASPSIRSISRGTSTQYTVTVSGLNGGAYSGQAVSLSVSGLPGRTSASFSPNPTSSTSTLTVITSRKSPTGTFRLTITGSNGSYSHSTTVNLSLH
jgi:uncharacterized membrane protein